MVDFQNDFIPEEVVPQGGRMGVPEAEQVAKTVCKLLALAGQRGTSSWRASEHRSFQGLI